MIQGSGALPLLGTSASSVRFTRFSFEIRLQHSPVSVTFLYTPKTYNIYLYTTSLRKTSLLRIAQPHPQSQRIRAHDSRADCAHRLAAPSQATVHARLPRPPSRVLDRQEKAAASCELAAHRARVCRAEGGSQTRPNSYRAMREHRCVANSESRSRRRKLNVTS